MLKAIAFLSEVKVELAKVVWPTREATLRLTLIVILVTIAVSFFVGGIDFLLTKALELLLNR